jgi:hypothetical protein
MNNYNNYAMPGLIGDGGDLFDFKAASSNTLWTGTHNSLARQAQTVQADEVIHVMPLTKSEIEAILAVRASNAQNYHHSHSLTPLELNANFSGLCQRAYRRRHGNANTNLDAYPKSRHQHHLKAPTRVISITPHCCLIGDSSFQL